MTKVEDLCEKLREMMRRALGVKFNWSSVMVKKVSDYPNLCDVIENGMLDLLDKNVLSCKKDLRDKLKGYGAVSRSGQSILLHTFL